MKYLIILSFLISSGCAVEKRYPTKSTTDIAAGVSKFRDDNITCYIYYTYGISCLEVKNEK